MEETQVMKAEQTQAQGTIITRITEVGDSFCTMAANTTADKAVIYNATNTGNKVKDHINEVLTLSNIYGEIVTVTDKQTGEVFQCPRIVLISPDGTAYSATSKGIFTSVKKILQIFGMPDTWDTPLQVKVKQVSTAPDRNVLMLEVVM